MLKILNPVKNVNSLDRSGLTTDANYTCREPELPFQVVNLVGQIDPPNKGHKYILCLLDQHTRRIKYIMVVIGEGKWSNEDKLLYNALNRPTTKEVRSWLLGLTGIYHHAYTNYQYSAYRATRKRHPIDVSWGG
ncbi:hypothetical protein NPIL_568341 [Nephila pilipes]|uniref:Uncharacterized protein n=1 Tax=Nephila pilipes TaxID=299642 RepID=A0A8X6ILM9_NEPPI|nr:hypothetical protein NPIL_568341 [Nephila pilipes]